MSRKKAPPRAQEPAGEAFPVREGVDRGKGAGKCLGEARRTLAEGWKRRTHLTDCVIKQVQVLPGETPQSLMGHKPNGFWYQVGRDWETLLFLRGMRRSMLPANLLVIVEVNLSRFKVIRTEAELNDFARGYACRPPWIDETSWRQEFNCSDEAFKHSVCAIDWPRLRQEFAGIEIAPYQPKFHHSMMWYYGWEVASGVVWDESAVRVIKTVKRKLWTR